MMALWIAEYERPEGDTGGYIMDWEQCFCPDPACVVDFWLVRQAEGRRDLWHLVDRFGDAAFMLAATAPVCPRCGTTLCLTVELAHRMAGARREFQVIQD